MDKLVCEICGGNAFSKDGDLFVCDYCKTKYTPAQARSMLIEGTVQIDRSNEATSLLNLAKAALYSGNHNEAYSYANRALEIDHQLSQAWQYKGEAAGWLSTMSDFRTQEMLSAFKTAWDLCPEGERVELRLYCASAINRIAVWYYNASCDCIS